MLNQIIDYLYQNNIVIRNKDGKPKIYNTSNLCSAIKANKPFKGFQISLTKESKLSVAEDKRNIKKKVGKFDVLGNLIATYESITEAKNANGPGCQKVLRGQQKIYKNHIYKYIS